MEAIRPIIANLYVLALILLFVLLYIVTPLVGVLLLTIGTENIPIIVSIIMISQLGLGILCVVMAVLSDDE